MNNDKTHTLHDRLQYFKSWASYRIPMRPTEPITYRDTESLVSYYAAFYDAKGQLTQFIKYFRKIQPAEKVPFFSVQTPRKVIYFKSIKDESGNFRRGEEITFLQTEDLTIYFQGVPDEANRSVTLDVVRSIVFFREEYSYWPNRTLQKRVSHKQDGTVVTSYFDQSGEELELSEDKKQLR